MDEERLIKIETTLMHHDRQIQDLEDVVNDQRLEIEVLQRRISRLRSKIDEMGQGSDENPSLSVSEQALRDKPPHY